MTTAGPALDLRRVSFGHVRKAPVLVDVDLTLARGERLVLVGPNGGGKTTLLRLILGLLEPDRGTVKVFGYHPAKVRKRVGYVPQHSGIDLSIPASALDVVLMGQLHRSSWGLRFGRDERERARAALDRVGLAAVVGRQMAELSGGQRQRVLIARALVSEPELLVLDEPTSSVDQKNQKAIFAALLDQCDSALVLVSHDAEQVRHRCHHVAHVERSVRPWPQQMSRPAE